MLSFISNEIPHFVSAPSRVLRRYITVPFGAEAPPNHVAYGRSNLTSLLRPALPMAPTTEDKAREKRSVLCLNPATF